METSKRYDISYLPAAVRDFSQIITAYTLLNGEGSARKLMKSINDAVENISLFPYASVAVPDDHLSKKHFHMAVIKKHLLIYRIFEEDKKVIVYRILNGRTNYSEILNRIIP